MNEATDMGAIAFFGDKYGDLVRVIKFGESIELCGGTHVQASGDIGLFRIISESAIAAGIRRIEACTGEKAIAMMQKEYQLLKEVNTLMAVPSEKVPAAIQKLQEENKSLQKELEAFRRKETTQLREILIKDAEYLGDDVRYVGRIIETEFTTARKRPGL